VGHDDNDDQAFVAEQYQKGPTAIRRRELRCLYPAQ